METVIKKQTAFSFSMDLLERLKAGAKRENISLNNYVENILMSAVYDEPNEDTKAAMEEARLKKNLKDVDMTSFETFIKSSSS